MAPESTNRPAGDRAARQAISKQQQPCLNSPTESLPQAPLLPRVVEARARDNLARARLRGLIPEKMARLECGRAWERAEKLRESVFGDGGRK